MSDRTLRSLLSERFTGARLEFDVDVPVAFGAARIDFLLRGGYAVLAMGELVLDAAFLRVRNVAADERVRWMLAVTTRGEHRGLPGGACRKPLDVFWIGGFS
jgi:hypothetical protein